MRDGENKPSPPAGPKQDTKSSRGLEPSDGRPVTPFRGEGVASPPENQKP